MVDAQVPAPIVNPHRGTDPRGELGLARQHVDQGGGVARGALADHGRQPGEATKILDRDDLALPVD